MLYLSRTRRNFAATSRSTPITAAGLELADDDDDDDRDNGSWTEDPALSHGTEPCVDGSSRETNASTIVTEVRIIHFEDWSSYAAFPKCIINELILLIILHYSVCYSGVIVKIHGKCLIPPRCFSQVTCVNQLMATSQTGKWKN